jgi:Uma2 family endonuclease
MVTSSGTRLTAAEFLLLPEDGGRRHELIDGVHYVTPSPTVTHQVLCGRLYLALGNFLAARPGLGRVFFPLDVVLSDYDVIAPDLLVVVPDQNEILTEMNVQGAPALAIEVLSPGTRRRDEGVKRRLLDEKGARECWIVDPKQSRVTVFRRAGDGTFPRVAGLEATSGVELTSPLLPGFTLSVEQLFSNAV